MTTQTTETKDEKTPEPGKAGQPDPSSDGKVDWESPDNPYKPFKARYDGLRRAQGKTGDTAGAIAALNGRLERLEEQNAELLDRLESATTGSPREEQDGEDEETGDRRRTRQPQPTSDARRKELQQARAADYQRQVKALADWVQSSWLPGMTLEDKRLARAQRLFTQAQAGPHNAALLQETRDIIEEVAAEHRDRANLDVKGKGRSSDNDKAEPAEGEGETDEGADDAPPPDRPNRRAALKKSGAANAQTGDGLPSPSDDSKKTPYELFRESHEEARKGG
jgi:hypothetical protein